MQERTKGRETSNSKRYKHIKFKLQNDYRKLLKVESAQICERIMTQ